MARPFLTAEWRHLVMLNYEVDAALLERFVPPGTELDSWEGRTYASVVGFLFLDTRLKGIPIPFHRDFEEVNLRFYVRRQGPEGRRRGVVFVRELVPRAAIAAVARLSYGEKYLALPMSHAIERGGEGDWVSAASFGWTFEGREGSLGLVADGPPREIAEGSLEEFIAEHYWGYSLRRDGTTTEYRVEHPRWRVAGAREAALDCTAAGLFGEEFGALLEAPPASAFLAEGSRVAVHPGARLPRAVSR